MKLRKKALLPAIAMVLASVIALSGVTYAWFTVGTTATVSNIDVNVATANGIQVSLDAMSWKSVIRGEDILAAAATKPFDRAVTCYPDGEISPVSSAGEIEDGLMKMFLGGYNTEGNLDSKEIEELGGKGGNFISFDLFFKSSGDQPMWLNISDDASSVKCIDLSKGGAASNAKTETAVRVAFIPVCAGVADATAAYNAKADSETKAKIWQPNHDVHVSQDTEDELNYMGFYTDFTNVPEDELGSGQVKLVESFNKNETEIIYLKAGISKVRVYIWLEGQDADCVNTISNGDFTVTLQFGVEDTSTTATTATEATETPSEPEEG